MRVYSRLLYYVITNITKQMNIRQYRYKENRLKGMNSENAAIAAGYSRSTARAKAYRIERSARVGIADAFEQAGLTDKFLAEHAKQGLNATKTVSAVIVGAEATDKTDDFIDVPDWQARHKYFDTILKVGGKIVNKVDVSGNITFTKMSDVEVVDVNNNNRLLEYSIGKSDN
jgi:hypothetical protein